MISKKNLKIVIIIVSVLILLIAVFYLISKKNINTQTTRNGKKIEIMSDDEKNSLNLYHLGVYEVVSRDEAGKVTASKLTKLEDEKPINVEFMTEEEKVEKDTPPSTKIQVLQRDKSGKVIAYKIIKNDSDILTKY